MTARKNTANAVTPTRRRSNAGPKDLADLLNPAKGADAAVATSKRGSRKVEEAKVEETPAEEAKVEEAATEEVKAETGDVVETETPKADKPAKPSKPKLVVLPEDLAQLVFVPVSQGAKAKTLHLDGCAFYSDKFGNGTTFVKATDEQLGSLKHCGECSRRAARTRVATAKTEVAAS